LNLTLQLDRNWPPASLGFPVPEQAETLALPSDEGPWLHYDQSVAPIEPAAEQHQCQPGRIVSTSGFDPAFLIERQLLAQEQILRRMRGSRAQAETQKVN
jgi:hypothetical protein